MFDSGTTQTEEITGPALIDNLNTDCMLLIFSYLEPQDLFRCERGKLLYTLYEIYNLVNRVLVKYGKKTIILLNLVIYTVEAEPYERKWRRKSLWAVIWLIKKNILLCYLLYLLFYIILYYFLYSLLFFIHYLLHLMFSVSITLLFTLMINLYFFIHK